jgi:cell division protein FtsQ
MWFKREQKNRRLRRTHVLDVKLRSDQVRATRVRLLLITLVVVFGTLIGISLIWRAGEAVLDAFVYHNADFAVQTIDAQTDGKIAPEEIRRWARVKLGVNLIGLDLAEVKRNIEMVPVIESVSVERVLPRTLRIRVTERDPIAQVNLPRADATGAIAVSVYQLDANGMVMQPLDPRVCLVPLTQMTSTLPVIAGMNAFQMQPGRRVESPQVQTALALVSAFERSPMAGLVDLRRLDVSAPNVIKVSTEQGSEVIFALTNLEQQFRRWRAIYDLGLRQQKTIATLDLAVANNLPVRWMVASTLPVTQPKAVKPSKPRRKNV